LKKGSYFLFAKWQNAVARMRGLGGGKGGRRGEKRKKKKEEKKQ
jgi:hypothetical protein